MSTRRDFIKSGGALIVGFSLGDALLAQAPATAGARSLDVKQVDTWLAIHADNTATVYIGFAELGQGASTALLQVAGGLPLVARRRLAVVVKNQVVVCEVLGGHDVCPLRVSSGPSGVSDSSSGGATNGSSACRIFLTARKILCLVAFVLSPSARLISSID